MTLEKTFEKSRMKVKTGAMTEEESGRKNLYRSLFQFKMTFKQIFCTSD
jgi:hypothetical protein